MAGEEAAPRTTNCCCNGKTFIQTLLFGIWTALGVALIVVGAKHRDNCVEEPFIPVYMVVAGAFSFAYWVLLPFECCFPTLRRIASLLVAMFVFAWFIAGSVWVFRIYHITNRDCHKGMYLFVFSILIIQYIFIALGVIAALLACLCCENSLVAKICRCVQNCLERCPCLDCLKCLQCTKCLECCKCLQCFKCCSCCSCLQDCSCLESCNCLQSCSCLECLKCLDCCKCSRCCGFCKSLCCCCKNIQCSSCLSCSMCTQCCKCLQCCTAKV